MIQLKELNPNRFGNYKYQKFHVIKKLNYNFQEIRLQNKYLIYLHLEKKNNDFQIIPKEDLSENLKKMH